MVWRPWDDRKIAVTDTVCHRVVYIPAVMRVQIIPNQNLIEAGARDIVHLDIPADVVTEVAKDIGRASNGTYTLNPMLRALHTPLNIWSLALIPWLDRKDDGNLCPVVVVSILFYTQYLHNSPPYAVTFLQCYPKLVTVNQYPSGHLEYTKRRRTVPKNPRDKTEHVVA